EADLRCAKADRREIDRQDDDGETVAKAAKGSCRVEIKDVRISHGDELTRESRYAGDNGNGDAALFLLRRPRRAGGESRQMQGLPRSAESLHAELFGKDLPQR